MSTTLKAWNLKQLQEAKIQDLALCNTVTERICCEAICNKEIRILAKEIQGTRKLTPVEVVILTMAGG